jgi:hypothetical protein
MNAGTFSGEVPAETRPLRSVNENGHLPFRLTS